MALSNTNVFDVRVGGSDTANGGAFDPQNANMATDLAATSANTSAPVVTSASYNFAARDVNAWLYIKAGTNWTPGWYKIASVASNAATLSAAAGAGYLAGSATIPASPGVTTAAGCATTASPTGGTWTIDYSQGTSPGITYTDMVIGATTTQYTSAANPVGPNIVGNVISVTSGTGFTVQYVQVVSVSGTTATCDKSLGTTASTGGNGGLGGCFATPGKAGAVMVSSGVNCLFIKANSASPDYTFSATANVSGGKCQIPGPSFVIGWNTVRTMLNKDATRPTFAPSANSVVMFYMNGQTYMRNLNCITPGHTSCQALQCDNGNAFVELCRWDGYQNTINVTFGTAAFWSCEMKNCSQGANGSANSIIGCTVNAGGNNSAPALSATLYADNIVYNFQGPGIGLLNNNQNAAALRNVAYGCNSSGFGGASTFLGTAENNVAWGNAVYGFDFGNSVATIAGKMLNNAAGNNTTANFRPPLATWNPSCITLTVDPFTNAAGGDFTPNNTAGGGALLRAAGFPTSWPGLATTNNIDSGAAQHAAGAAGGVPHLAGRGGGLVA
jgi:hypothetical protein